MRNEVGASASSRSEQADAAKVLDMAGPGTIRRRRLSDAGTRAPSVADPAEQEKELERYRALFELTARLNSKVSTSKAVHELVHGIHSLVQVGGVVFYFASPLEEDDGSGSGSVSSRSPSSRSPSPAPSQGALHDRQAQQGYQVLYPIISDEEDSEAASAGTGSSKQAAAKAGADRAGPKRTATGLQVVSGDPLASMAGFVAFSGETVWLNDIPSAVSKGAVAENDALVGHRNAVLIPILFGTHTEPVGVLQCVDTDRAEGFSDIDITILEAIAANAGNVLHKFVLFDSALAAQRRASALLDLANASRHIREDSHVHLPNLIERLMMSVYKVMRADRVSLYLCDAAKRELWCCISKDYKGSRVPYGVGIIGTVANSGLMLNIRDCYQDRRFNPSGDRFTGYLTRSMLAAPVSSSAGNLVAVLVVINKVAIRGSSEPILPPLEARSDGGFKLSAYSALSAPPALPPHRPSAGPTASFGAEDWDSAAADQNEYAGITFFTREDEMILESISTEIGNVLERNALDAHYENVISEVLNEQPRDFSKILTASLLAETTTSNDFHRDVAGLTAHRRSSSVVIRTARSKARMFKLVSRLTYFFRAVGIFQRMLRRLRGFQFCVKNLDQCKCSSRRSAADNKKRFKLLKRRSCSAEILEHVGTKVCPGAQYVVDLDTSSTSAVPLSQELVAQSRQWCLNVFDLDGHTSPHLVRLGLEHLGLAKRFAMADSTVLSFVRAIKDSYLPSETCPYHNWDHAMGVFQMCFALAVQSRGFTGALEPIDLLALLVAALGHDAGHEGRNNDFEIKVASELALRYNDSSVLEQHHAALTFQILRRPGNNILQCASRQTELDFRKVAIAAILATDMSMHFDHVKKVSNRLASLVAPAPGAPARPLAAAYKRAELTDRLELVNFVLHSIDVGGQCYPYEQSRVWSERLLEEFIAQAADERQLGFEPAPYMVGLERPLRQAVLQKSFTENIVQPVWLLMTKLFPETFPLLANLEDNIRRYNDQIRRCEEAEAVSTGSAPMA